MGFLKYGDDDIVRNQNPLILGTAYNTIENLIPLDNLSVPDLSRSLMNIYDNQLDNRFVLSSIEDQYLTSPGVLNTTNFNFDFVSGVSTLTTVDFMERVVNGITQRYVRLQPGVARFSTTEFNGASRTIVNKPRIKLGERQIARALGISTQDGSEYVKINYSWIDKKYKIKVQKVNPDLTVTTLYLPGTVTDDAGLIADDGTGYNTTVDMLTALYSSSVGSSLNLLSSGIPRLDLITIEPIFYIGSAGTYYLRIGANGSFLCDITAPTGNELALWTLVIASGTPWTVAATDARKFGQVAFGVGALACNTTGSDNSAFGTNALCSNTNGISNSAFGSYALQYDTTGFFNSAFGSYALQCNTIGYCNSAFGTNALYYNTTGNQNSAFGSFALGSNTTGTYNAAFGSYALTCNITGSNNSAFGTNALCSNTNGYFNSAFGNYALQCNTTGYFNSAFGGYALYLNTTGTDNSAFGYQALRYNTTGSDNSAFGIYALYCNTTGNANSAFGTNALYRNITGYNNSAFGTNALSCNTIGNSNSAFGGCALSCNTIGSNNSAFGTNALCSNTTGIFNSAFGTNALSCNTTGFYNSAFGFYALSCNTAGYCNSAFGSYALNCNTIGWSNSAFGDCALYCNTTGSANSAFGIYALSCNTTGNQNSAFGYQALYCNTTGNVNSAFGSYALSFNTTGYNNSAFGIYALSCNTIGSNNSAFGNSALLNNTTGINNSAFGMNALQNNSTGINNTAFGKNSGYGALTNSYSTYLGAYTCESTSDGINYETVIGACACGYGSCSITLGRTIDTVYIPGNFKAGNTVIPSACSVAMTASQFGNIIIMTASGTTATLPQINTVSVGYDFYVKNASTGTVTVATYSGDTMDGVASLILNSYESIIVVRGGSTWSII